MLVDLYQSIMDFLPFEYWQGPILVLKIISGILTVVLLGAIAFFLKNSNYIKMRWGYDFAAFFKKSPVVLHKVVKQWSLIQNKLDSFNDSDWKLAIIEADKLADRVVKNLGGKGETLGERLNSLPEGKIQHINELWQAHKVRNNIVHDPDYRMSRDAAKAIIGYYELFLREFEIL